MVWVWYDDGVGMVVYRSWLWNGNGVEWVWEWCENLTNGYYVLDMLNT